MFTAYYPFFKILDNPRRLHSVSPRNISELMLSKKTMALITNYNESDSSRLFTQPAKPNVNYAKNKTGFALWFVSNCHSKGTLKRMKIYQELKKYIPVDVFGEGGSCDKYGVRKDPCKHNHTCSRPLMSTYKFYLSFENSECNYYITGMPCNHYVKFQLLSFFPVINVSLCFTQKSSPYH